MGAQQILDFVDSAGLIGLLVLILWGGMKRIWVYGWQYLESLEAQKRLIAESLEIQKRLIAERDEWRQLALRGTALSERIVERVRNGGVAQ